MMKPTTRSGAGLLRKLLLVAALAVATVLLLKPLYDGDFFWHLKTGAWIWQHGRLPDRDPFCYTSPNSITAAVRFTLTSYWLSQLLLYLAHSAWGMPGIVALRFLLMALLLLAAGLRLRRDAIVSPSLLLLFTVLILKFYLLERPQTLSLVCFGFLLLALERLRISAASFDAGVGSRGAILRLGVAPGLVMLLWGNVHGGHLVGQITLTLCLVTEGVKFLHPRLAPLGKKGYVMLAAACVAALGCSLINPNPGQALLLMLRSRGSDPSAQIQEYASLPAFFQMTHAHVVILYLALLILVAILLLASPKKLDLTETLLLAGLGCYAFLHVRYAGFFPIAAIPFLDRRLSETSLVAWARWVLVPVALGCALFFGQQEFSRNMATAASGAWISNRQFPVAAADFVISHNLQGNMYNQYDWGGYLIWRLAPGRKVFADGRNLNPEALLHDYLISTAQMNSLTGEKVWQSLLQRYGINYLVAYGQNPQGELTPLAAALLANPQWVPVFSDPPSRSMIFVRNTPENALLIRENRIVPFFR